MKGFNIIIATDEKNGIGKNNSLCWKLKEDLRYFKEVTTKVKDKNKKNAVIMGRKTWESIPLKFRPLINRENIILTRNKDYLLEGEGTVYNSFDEAMKDLEKKENIENIFLIGGATLYNSLIEDKRLKKIFLTKVNKTFKCDTFFKGIPEKAKLKKISKKIIENHISFQFLIYKK